MAVRSARFAHCVARRPVEYRGRSPFRPEITAPLDFSARVGDLYTLDHELDRAVLRPGDYATIVNENLEGRSGPGSWAEDGLDRLLSLDPRGRDGRRSPPSDSSRRRFLENHLRLSRESARFRPPWTVGLVQDAHAFLLEGLEVGGSPGTFRTRRYVATDTEGDPVLQTCPPERIAGDLQAVLDWVDRYGAAFHPLIPATVLFQAAFSIRPFPTGSMTVGRALASLYLRYHGLPNVAMTPVAAVSRSSPELTDQLLLWTEATGSYTELIDHSLDSVVLAYATATRRWLGDADPDRRLEEVQRRLLARARRESGWFSARDAMQWVGAHSDQTILRHLNELVARGIFESLGRTRGKRFRLAPPRVTSGTSLEPGPEDAADPDPAPAPSPDRRGEEGRVPETHRSRG